MTSKQLTPELIRDLIYYDPKTGDAVWKVRDAKHFSPTKISRDICQRIWNAQFAGKPINNVGGERYFTIGLFAKTYLLHRVIWMYIYGEWPELHIDHINQDRQDNRIANLRQVTVSENGKNMSLPSDNKSGVIGVSYHKNRRKWRAEITSKGTKMHLGLFSTKALAAEARRQAEVKYGFHPNHGNHLLRETK